jgi:hypothetical protein
MKLVLVLDGEQLGLFFFALPILLSLTVDADEEIILT